MRRITPWLVTLVVSFGCGARTPLGTATETNDGCHALAPVCIARASDPCGAAHVVPPSCDASHEWVCPSDARVYARAEDAPAVCRPFQDPSTGVATTGPWGLSSIVRIPIADRCIWIAEDVKFTDGTEHRNVAFEPDLSAPYGTCPTTSLMAPTPIVTMAGGDDPNLLTQIDGGYEIAGVTHVIYRLFRIDPQSAFGVTEIGGGVAAWDPNAQRIIVPSATTPFPWGLDLDLGSAVLANPDGTSAFVWGCSGGGLTEGCRLAQLDASNSVQIFSSQGWIASNQATDGVTVFDSGTWIASVSPTLTGFEHVFIAGFGKTLETHEASTITGPWTKGSDLGACDLPSGDTKAFCAGPIVHTELADPTRPSERVISYSVGSTGPMTSNPNDYWPRVVWVK